MHFRFIDFQTQTKNIWLMVSMSISTSYNFFLGQIQLEQKFKSTVDRGVGDNFVGKGRPGLASMELYCAWFSKFEMHLCLLNCGVLKGFGTVTVESYLKNICVKY